MGDRGLQHDGVTVVCPLEIERAAAERALRAAGLVASVRLICSGPGPENVRRVVEGLAAAPRRVIIMAGLAGGLADLGPERAPPVHRVVDEAGRQWACRSALGRSAGVTIAGVDEIVHGTAEKRALHQRTGAVLVDTESHAFAAACERIGARWGVVRAVSDGADETLPKEAAGWVDSRGRTRVGRVMLDIAKRPRLIGELIALQRRSAAALEAMGARVVQAVRQEAATAVLGGVGDDAGVVILFGGTFDPPHRGHAELGERVRRAIEELRARPAWLVYIPAARNPLKDDGPAAGDADRVEMLRLATIGRERTTIWPDELNRAGGGASYTIDTVRRAREALPTNVELRLLIGADQAASFHRWREPRGIIAIAEPLVMLRSPQDDAEGMIAAIRSSEAWSDEELGQWRRRIIPVGTMDASATEVRAALAQTGRDRRRLVELLGPDVLAYIEARGLYRRAEVARPQEAQPVNPSGRPAG